MSAHIEGYRERKEGEEEGVGRVGRGVGVGDKFLLQQSLMWNRSSRGHVRIYMYVLFENSGGEVGMAGIEQRWLAIARVSSAGLLAREF